MVCTLNILCLPIDTREHHPTTLIPRCRHRPLIQMSNKKKSCTRKAHTSNKQYFLFNSSRTSRKNSEREKKNINIELDAYTDF